MTSGIRVVEFGDSIASAYCGKLLADYGADVLKVELPAGDSLRAYGAHPDGTGWDDGGSLFGFLNTSKRSLSLDWRTADGRALVARLLEAYDVAVHPFGQEERAAIGLGDAHGRLVEVAVTACGLTGPYAEHPHTPLTMAALTGWSYCMGDPDKPPLYPGGPYISYLAATSAAIAALVALEAREQTGEGQLVDVSEFETGLANVPFDTVQFSYAGTMRERSGDLYSNNPLAAIYPCADGFVQFQVGFRAGEFLRVIGGDTLAEDPRFLTADGRSANREALRTIILDWLKGQRRWELFDLCARKRLVFSAVPDMGELLTLPPHLERRFFEIREAGSFAGIQFPGPAIRFGDGRWQSAPAPPRGGDTAAVAGELGVTGGALVALRERGVL